MGSIFQSLGLEQNDPLRQKTGNSNDRDITVAHLLAASGYASAPVDQATKVAYSPTSNIADYFFKSTSDANVTPLKATDSIRAAESVSISTAPPLIRSALTTNLLSPEPTMIKALLAPEDPNCRNLSQTDAPPPRPVTTQAELPVLRMLKETAAVPVVTQTAEVAVSRSLPTVTRADAPPVVQANPLRTVEMPLQTPANNGELKPVAAVSTTDVRTNTPTRNDSPLPVAPLPTLVRNEGTPIVAPTQVRNDNAAIVPALINASNQIGLDGTKFAAGTTRPDAGQPEVPLSNARYETSIAVAREGVSTRDVPQPVPAAPITSIIAQMSQARVTVPDTLVKSVPVNEQFSKDTYESSPSANPASRQPTERQSQLPSAVVPSSPAERGPLPQVVQRPETSTVTSDGAPRPLNTAAVPDRPGTPVSTNDRVSDTPRPASTLPAVVSERPSTSGVPDATRPGNTGDSPTGRVSPTGIAPCVDNNGRPVVDSNIRPGADHTRPTVDNTKPTADNTRPGADNTRPGVDNTRPGVDVTRPGVDNTRPGVDVTRPGVDNTRPGVDNTRPGVDGTRPGVENNLRPGVDGNLKPGIDNTKPGVDNTRPGVPGDPTRQDGLPRTTQDGRIPDGRNQDVPRTNAEGRPLDATRPGLDSTKSGQDGRQQDPPQRSGVDGRPQDGSRTGLDGRAPEGNRVAPDSRGQEIPKPDFRSQDPSKTLPADGRPQDGPKANLDGRPQDGQRTNTEGAGRVEPNRNINQEGIRTSEQKSTEAPKGELGRSGATEGRTTDGGKANPDGAAKNLDGSGVRIQEPGRINDGANIRPSEQSVRNQDGIRNIEQNVAAKSIDGTQVRNPEIASSVRSENQSGKLDTARPDAASNRSASDSIPQSTSARPGEVRAENVANRTGESRPENVANRTGEPRPENVANRTGEPRPENVANRTGEPRPENVANRTGEPRPENVANRTGEPRPENIANRSGEPRPENIANRSGEPRLDNSSNRTGEVKPDSVANKSIESVPPRTNEPSKPGEIAATKTGELAGTKPGEIRTEMSANRVSETPIVKNNEAGSSRGEIPSNRPSDVVSNKVDGTVNRGMDVPNGRTPDGSDASKPSDRVGLNIDAARQPQIAIPTDMVATQKEAAAIRQILSELKQNQNLTSSEVLELPSFKEALRLLDALIPKDGESTQDGKQHFTTSFVEAMRLSDFLKVLEKANEVEQKKIHKQQWAARSLSQNQHRVRYLVQKNDTLESIAEKILGDIRFVQLLVTINRAEIIFTYVNGKSFSTVYEGQYLWIPTPNEVSIHRKHYFNANSAAVRGEPLAPEAETPIMVEEYEAPTTVRDFATRLRSVTAPPVGAHGDPLSSPMAVVLYRLRFAGNRNSVNLDEVEETPAEERRRYKVRLGETLQSIAVNDELMKDVNMWLLICRVNELDTAVDVVGRPRAQLTRGDIINLPNQAEIEEFKLLNRLMEIAELSGKKIDIEVNRKPAAAKASPHCKVDRQMSIEKLWDRCRMILTDNDDTSYSIKLQRDTLEGKWTTVASYESKGGKTLRWTYKIDGSKNCLEVGLPAAVSREMAIEDFQRNWRFYYNRYTAIKTDTLELLDLSEAANR